MASLALVFCTILIFSTYAFAATYYVDANNGNDSNPGTESQPWETLIYACAQLTAGDTLYVKNGTYYSQDRPEWYIPGITFSNSGTQQHPIIVKNYPGHTPVIIGMQKKYPSKPIPHSTMGAFEKSWIVIDGLKFEKAVIFWRADTLAAGQNITIQNCDFDYGFRNPDDPSYVNFIWLDNVEYITVRNNTFSNNKWWGLDRTNGVGIIHHWCRDVVIENNEFEECVIAYRPKKGSGEPGSEERNCVFRYNMVRNCEIGVYVGGYSNATIDQRIYQNIFVDTHYAILINIGNTNTLIYNNTFYNNPGYDPRGDPTTGIWYIADSIATNKNHQIYNNIIANFQSPITITTQSNPPNLYCDYNCYHNFQGFFRDWKWKTFAHFKISIGGDQHSIISAPRFLRPPKDFRLSDNSPCNGTGKNRVNIGVYVTGGELIGSTLSPLTDTLP